MAAMAADMAINQVDGRGRRPVGGTSQVHQAEQAQRAHGRHGPGHELPGTRADGGDGRQQMGCRRTGRSHGQHGSRHPWQAGGGHWLVGH